jgi:hypothetical protein
MRGVALTALLCVVEVIVHRGSWLGLIAASCLGIGFGSLVGLLLSFLPARMHRWVLPVVMGLGGAPLYWALTRAHQLLPRHHDSLAVLAVIALAAGVGLVAEYAVRRRFVTHGLLQSRAMPWLAGVVAAFALLPVAGEHAALLSRALVYGAVLLAGLVLLLWPRPLLLGLAALTGNAAVLVLPNTYMGLQLTLGWVALFATVLACKPAQSIDASPQATELRSGRGLWGSLLLIPALLWLADRAWQHQGFHAAARGGVASALASSIRTALDWDRDGYAFLFSPYDCAPLNAAIYPGAEEIPGNASDENCAFGPASNDLTLWYRELPASPAPPPRWQGDMVWVWVDSLRPDEARSALAPHLNRFFEGAVYFDRAYSTSTFTPQSLLGILAGQLPSGSPFNWVGPFNGCPKQPPVGLPAALQERQYRTALVGVPTETTDCFAAHTFGNGFTDVEGMSYFSSSEAVTARAVRTWKELEGDQPRFMLVHYLAVHNAYESREAYREQLRLWDDAFRTLRDAVGDQALWVLFGDHGEEFYERGNRGHANTLYDEVTHVPLAVAAPTLTAGRITSVSSLLSLPQTVLAMVDPQGRLPNALPRYPLLCLSPSSECVDHPAPMELHRQGVHLRGLVNWPNKVIHDVNSGKWQVFNLVDDPGEKSPLFASAPHMKALSVWEEYAFAWRPQ